MKLLTCINDQKLNDKPNIRSSNFDHMRQKPGNKNFEDNFKL